MCQIIVVLAHNDYGIIPSTWLFLDTCYTTRIGKNPDMFNNIRECLEEDRINVVTNNGNKALNEIGKYEIFPINVHFNLHSMANIFALKDMANVPGFQITMGSSKECTIKVKYQDKVYRFKELHNRLYYYDTAAKNYISYETDKSNAPITPYLFLSTIEDNKSYFSSNEIEG